MLQYSLNRDSGRCAFADRYGFRLEMSWRRVAGIPDVDRMISDYLAKLQAGGMDDGRKIKAAGCQGLAGTQDGSLMTRFGCYAPEEKCVVEILFIWPDQRDQTLEHDVLKSFHNEIADERGKRRWRAFGMDVWVPGECHLGSCCVEPAHVRWQFVDSRGRPLLNCARRGMVREWMQGSVRDWLEKNTALKHRSAVRWSHVQRSGHDVTRVEGIHPPSGWLRRSRPIHAEAWICPADGRLYNWSGDDAVDLDLQPLTCCDGRTV